MGLTGTAGARRQPHGESPATRELIWHDLEVGGYRADLPLWRELAGATVTPPGAEPILEVGAGSGRVALELARNGHRVTALDVQPGLLAALRQRASGLPVQTACADARALSLGRREFALCLVPMQTLQLLGGEEQRSAFLRGARAHLREGGLLACAIVTELEPFDCAAGDPAPEPETLTVGGRTYLSRATAVRVRPDAIEIERERQVVTAGVQGRQAVERELITLARVSAPRLEREGARAGFRPAGVRSIPATADHVGSTAVMLGA